MKKRLLAMCGVLLLSLPSPAEAAPLEFRMQSIYGPTQLQNTEILAPWAKSVGEKTQGDVVLHFFNGSAIVGTAEVYEAVKSSMLDIGIWSPHKARLVPHTMLVTLPFMAENARQGAEICWSMYETIPEFKHDVDSAGVMLGMWTGTSYAVSSLRGPIRSPADFQGKRVLIILPQDSKAVEYWGGIPVHVPPGDVYVGLQRGMGEMFLAPVPYQKGIRIMEVAEYLTILPFTSTIMTCSMNKDAFEDLTPEQQTLVTGSFGKELSLQIADSLDQDGVTGQSLFKHVTILTEEEMQVFRDAQKTSVEEYWIPRLRELGISGDAAAWVKKAYEISAAIATAQ